jgi:uncharacterized membrane protein HdeD (DUF308 family)
MLMQEARDAIKEFTDSWWLFVLAGIAWIIVSLVVLRMNVSSVATVGILLGVLFMVSAIEEIFIASVRSSWAWARVLLAVFFFFGSIWCFVAPFDAFWSLAAALGFLLVFKGILDVAESVATQAINDIWWLGLMAGILEVGLGFWASQQTYPTRGALLLLYVGFYALFRGISEIVLAFQLRAAN